MDDSEKPKKLIIKGKNGGKRPGAGMPKGTKIQRTIEKERTLKEYQEMIRNHALQLFHAQKVLAFGSYTLFVVEHYEDESGKIQKRKVLVEDTEMMEAILNNPDMVQGDNYVVIQTNSPDKFTIDSMLDRAFGKATQSLDANIQGNVTILNLIDELKKSE